MKRISVTIQYKNNPDLMVNGYALSHEILPNQVSFFAAQKFPVDEELNVLFSLNGEKQSLTVTMKHMHEQISSGRIMNAMPTDERPFTARKFYRCYSAVVGAEAIAKNTLEEVKVETKAEAPITSEAEATQAAVTADDIDNIMAATPVEAPVEKKNVMDFGAEAPAPSLLPEVGDIAPVDMDEIKAA